MTATTTNAATNPITSTLAALTAAERHLAGQVDAAADAVGAVGTQTLPAALERFTRECEAARRRIADARGQMAAALAGVLADLSALTADLTAGLGGDIHGADGEGRSQSPALEVVSQADTPADDRTLGTVVPAALQIAEGIHNADTPSGADLGPAEAVGQAHAPADDLQPVPAFDINDESQWREILPRSECIDAPAPTIRLPDGHIDPPAAMAPSTPATPAADTAEDAGHVAVAANAPAAARDATQGGEVRQTAAEPAGRGKPAAGRRKGRR